MSTETKTETSIETSIDPKPQMKSEGIMPTPPPKRKKKWRKLKMVLIVLGLLAALVIWMISCASSALQVGVMYQEYTATHQDLEVVVSDSGTVEPADSYTVTALVTGEILEDFFEEGQLVEKDASLYTIDSGDLDYQIQRAELALQQAQIQYNNLKTALSPSPTVSGKVQRILVKTGDNVTAGTPVAELSNSDTMTIKVPFHSTDASTFSVGQTATLTLEGNMEQLSATVTTISGADEIGAGGVLTRMVELTVQNPGAISERHTATAMINNIPSMVAGTFQNAMSQTVVATSTGTITAIHVSEGDTISANSAICTIGGTATTNSLKTASIAVENAEIGLASTVDLLENYQITAPISGTVVDKNLKTGDNVEPTSGAMAVLYDMSYLTFTLNIDELDVSKLKVGQSVAITSNALPDHEFVGVVDKISINGTIMDGVTTYPVTILIEDGGALLPGMNVAADIMVEKVGNVLAIPLSSVVRGDTVMVLPADGYDRDGKLDPSKMQSVSVTLGRSNEEFVEVLSGIEEGQIVITTNYASNIMDEMMKMATPPSS